MERNESNFREAFINEYVNNNKNTPTAIKETTYEIEKNDNKSVFDKVKGFFKSEKKRKVNERIIKTGALTTEELKAKASKVYASMSSEQKMYKAKEWIATGKNLIVTRDYLTEYIVRKQRETPNIEEPTEKMAKEMMGVLTSKEYEEKIKDEMKRMGIEPKEELVQQAKEKSQTANVVKPVKQIDFSDLYKQSKDKEKDLSRKKDEGRTVRIIEREPED